MRELGFLEVTLKLLVIVPFSSLAVTNVPD
jgi:hypothetical protein